MAEIVDLFCGAGGCSAGYVRAGFTIRCGVDIKPQPRYPFGFVQADALEWLRAADLSGVDAIHASPPCQAYSTAAVAWRAAGKRYPDLLAATRAALMMTGKPWVIENVPGAPMRRDLEICGCHVGLPNLVRKRWFEFSFPVAYLAPSCHHPDPILSVVGHGAPSWTRAKWGRCPTIAECRAAMGIDWMNRGELSQAIPPAYTELVGGFLLAHVEARRERELAW